MSSVRTVRSPRKQDAARRARHSCDPAQGPPPGRAPRVPLPELDREAVMEVLLLLLDEIDDFCLMVLQRAGMLIS
jgi:hypothetical protein